MKRGHAARITKFSIAKENLKISLRLFQKDSYQHRPRENPYKTVDQRLGKIETSEKPGMESSRENESSFSREESSVCHWRP